MRVGVEQAEGVHAERYEFHPLSRGRAGMMEVGAPSVAKEYNALMSGVVRRDHLRVVLSTQRKCVKCGGAVCSVGWWTCHLLILLFAILMISTDRRRQSGCCGTSAWIDGKS